MSTFNRTGVRSQVPAVPLAAPARAQEPAALASAAPVAFEGKRALLVEDSWHIAVAMKCLLENTGLTVIGPAARSEAAEAMLVGSTPDVAVVDVNLHGKLAIGLVERLNERRVPVIVVSGYEMVEGLEGKVAAFLTKPVRSRALIAALQSALTGGAIC